MPFSLRGWKKLRGAGLSFIYRVRRGRWRESGMRGPGGKNANISRNTRFQIGNVFGINVRHEKLHRPVHSVFFPCFCINCIISRAIFEPT